jgi:ATP-binding cassette subfamily F protein 3
LIIVSHDRYFVEKLATKIIEIGHAGAVVYPGTYTEFLWHKEHPADQLPTPKGPTPKARPTPKAQSQEPKAQSPKPDDREARKRLEAERKKQQRAADALRKRIADLEGRIAEREAKVKDLEATMSAPGFYEDRDASRHAIEQHQALMWEVGDLMAQWEALQEHAAQSES